MSFRTRALAVVAVLVLITAVSALYLGTQQPKLEGTLIVYGPKGIRSFANEAVRVFSQRYGVNATFVHYGMGSIEIANRLISEKSSPTADVILGIPEFYAKPVIESDVLEAYSPPNLGEIPLNKIWDPSGHILPVDEGYIVIVYNETIVAERHLPVPSTLDDLLDPRFKGLLIYPNPLTSGTGLSFLTWVLTEKGEDAGWQYLHRLKENVIFYPSGWTDAMDAFIRGEAAVGVMFNTDTVYSETPNLNSTMSRGFVYREGIALVKGAPHKEAAKKFIEFMLSKEGQDLAAPWGYVYPVRPDATLSGDVARARTPSSLVSFNPSLGGNADVWRDRWNREILGS
jgi:thiamine transport system substrate-binding protein